VTRIPPDPAAYRLWVCCTAEAVVSVGLRHARMMARCRPRPPVPVSEFTGFRFPPEVIVLAVRWYLRFALSYRDVEELLAERGLEVDHVTIFRRVRRFTPLLVEAARPCRHRLGSRWFADETYIRSQVGESICIALPTSTDRSSTCSPATGATSSRPAASSALARRPAEVTTDKGTGLPAGPR